MSFKDSKDSDYVAGGVWASKGPNRYLLDQIHGRLSFPETLQAVRDLTAKYPKAVAKFIEDKANGSAVIATLRQEIPGLIPVNPEGGKISRAQAVSAYVEGGNVYLPHPSLVSWVDGFIGECAAFPNGRYDDQVDQMTQALLRIQTRPRGRSKPTYTDDRPSFSGREAWMG
jgi:predicted phage terminase large subunit-like protein